MGCNPLRQTCAALGAALENGWGHKGQPQRVTSACNPLRLICTSVGAALVDSKRREPCLRGLRWSSLEEEEWEEGATILVRGVPK